MPPRPVSRRLAGRTCRARTAVHARHRQSDARRRDRRQRAGHLAGPPRDPRNGHPGARLDARLLRGRTARRARRPAADRRRRTCPAGQRRGPPTARPEQRPTRHGGRRPPPAGRPVRAAERRADGVRRTAPRRARRGRGQPAARAVRPDRHAAGPHPVAGAARRAGRGPQPGRVAAGAEPRGLEPPAHRRQPDRDRPPRTGPGVRGVRTAVRPGDDRSRGRHGRRPGARVAAARQAGPGAGTRRAAHARTRLRGAATPGCPRRTWSPSSATCSTTRSRPRAAVGAAPRRAESRYDRRTRSTSP